MALVALPNGPPPLIFKETSIKRHSLIEFSAEAENEAKRQLGRSAIVTTRIATTLKKKRLIGGRKLFR
jgi:hypothetical protein